MNFPQEAYPLETPQTSPSEPPNPQETTEQKIKRISHNASREMERLKKEYPIIQEAYKLAIQLPNILKYHKPHLVNHVGGSAPHAMIFLILYDRERKPAQFTESTDPSFLPLAFLAAISHDLGIVNGLPNHEEESVKITHRLMDQFKFMPDKKDYVQMAIMDTKIQKTEQGYRFQEIPSNTLAALLMDADMANLGHRREQSFMTDRIAEEQGKEPNDPTVLSEAHQLMSDHTWKTQAAEELFTLQKSENLAALETKITDIKQGGK